MIGAGAAGAMASIFSASAGAETLLLESTRDGGRKILISGGGRCNILPISLDESRFITDSSGNTLRKIVRSWPLTDQIAFFTQEAALPLVSETASGKLFPASHRARDVRDGLLVLARQRGVRTLTNCRVTGLAATDAQWCIERAGDQPLMADAVILATGGLSVPKTGSDGAGLAIARRLGHTIHPTYPALTPLLARPAPFAALAGISLTVTITARAGDLLATATGGFLFTHHGYSGPAVLDVSHVVARGGVNGLPVARVMVRWTGLHEKDWENALRPAGARTVAASLRGELPERLALALLTRVEVPESRLLSELRREERLRLIETLVRCPLPVDDHDGYAKAEVTGGGVSLAEINPKTMESRLAPGLFLCGEMLDAFGPIGGYNFVWAWVTGRAAGLGAAASARR